MENCKISRDLMIEILARLPVRSLMRFKSVCKFFYSLIKNDRHFKNKHYEISRAKSDYVVFQREIGVAPWPMRSESVFGLVYKQTDCDEIGCVDLPMPISLIKSVTCVDGIICLVTYRRAVSESVIWYILIWNPSTREIMELPFIKPHDQSNPHYKAVGFGLSSNMTGKVVMIWISDDPQILPFVLICSEVGNSWTWRGFSISLPILDVDEYSDFYLKGKHYWRCTFKEQKHEHLLWFDYTDEVFGKIELPPNPPGFYHSGDEIHSWATISIMNDTIALISYLNIEEHIEVWSMKEHNNIISWHKYTSFYCGNRYWHPMRIWNMGGHLLAYSGKLDDDEGGGYVSRLISVDLVTHERKVINNIEWICSLDSPFVYSESLKLF